MRQTVRQRGVSLRHAFLGTSLLWVTSLSQIPVAHAGPILQGGTETASGLGYGRNFMHGYDFVANDDLFLTALGFWYAPGFGIPPSYQVGVWDTGTQTLLASAAVDFQGASSSSPLGGCFDPKTRLRMDGVRRPIRWF